ncbi:FusB/FusC family EF-G-binding protein [Paenibacillus gansuensis]|uniref:FusB/FusC family EF-G-binding protein n=1 Tax=Paenibacillus gansuensis TaxID=306542 RepID=A0ABW5PEW2_9BACL
MEPFLHNHQYNLIAKQAKVLLSALRTSSDRKVIEAARSNAISKSAEVCSGADRGQMMLVERMGDLKEPEQLESYLSELGQYRIPFPELSEKQIKSMFPKVKKLRLPDLDAVKGKALTYLGWTDVATNRMFLVYPGINTEEAEPRMISVEGRFTADNRKGICAFCNRMGETVLYTAESKVRRSSIPDYYKAVGQYICADSKECNTKITELDALEKFLAGVTG